MLCAFLTCIINDCACFRLRAYGSAALNMCAVAQGRGDGYVEHGIHCWDIAAGAVIVREAGGVVLDPSGKCLYSHSFQFFQFSFSCCLL